MNDMFKILYLMVSICIMIGVMSTKKIDEEKRFIYVCILLVIFSIVTIIMNFMNLI